MSEKPEITAFIDFSGGPDWYTVSFLGGFILGLVVAWVWQVIKKRQGLS